MANKKKQKYPSKIQRPRREGPIKVKLGRYDGSSDDFVVSGHSTGSHSEMEEIAAQLSKDLNQVPEYTAPMSRTKDDGEYHGYEGEGLGDLGGPEFYGNKPSLLKKSPIHFANEARKLSIGTSIAALAGSAVLAGLAYAIYKNVKSSDESAQTKTAQTKTEGASARAAKVAAVKSSVRAKAPSHAKAKSKAKAAPKASPKIAKPSKASRRSNSATTRA